MESAIGIDFGGTTIKSGLVRGGAIVARGPVIDTQTCGGPDQIIDALVGVVEALSSGSPVAVGVGLPGTVDAEAGMVNELTNVAGWRSIPLRALLEKRTGLVATVENDANAMAYGEWRYGAAQNGRYVVCVTLGTGVGGGLILDGRLYRGAQMGAGEIGHMSIDHRGVRGHYGNLGALEKYVGNHQIAERAQALYAQAGHTHSIEECTPAQLSANAASGDTVALGLWETVGEEIGSALCSVIWLLNPDTIVIGGGVARAGALLFDPIQRTIQQQTGFVFHDRLRVVAATLGNDAGIIGNASLALEAAARARKS
jgi:glucokinase